MKILGENKAFNIINARRKARELSTKTITKDKISKDFFQTEEEPEKESEKEKKGIKIPGLANTPFNSK
jgi:hypothetical protein